jgi:NAD-dependent SIR2 family protein deacetylase
MIAQLFELSTAATPTPFHRLLQTLDRQGKLLRVYTQNIDGIEFKSGLSLGLPEGGDRQKRSSTDVSSQQEETISLKQSSSPGLCSVPGGTPICIPLHGTIHTLYCRACTSAFPLGDYLPSLKLGNLPNCPRCTVTEEMRICAGKRAHGVGKLRPNIVLYNEEHKDAELVGEVVLNDLVKGRKEADLVLVVGTSLKIPGTKRLVREFANAIHSCSARTAGNAPSHSSKQIRASHRTDITNNRWKSKVLYLNLDFPRPMRDWGDIFDVWIHGDAQIFSEMLRGEIEKGLEGNSKTGDQQHGAGDSLKTAQLQLEQGTRSAPRKPPKRPRFITPTVPALLVTVIRNQTAAYRTTQTRSNRFSDQQKIKITTPIIPEKENLGRPLTSRDSPIDSEVLGTLDVANNLEVNNRSGRQRNILQLKSAGQTGWPNQRYDLYLRTCSFT